MEQNKRKNKKLSSDDAKKDENSFVSIKKKRKSKKKIANDKITNVAAVDFNPNQKIQNVQTQDVLGQEIPFCKTLLLAIEYNLSQNNSIAVGYHPTSLKPIVLLNDFQNNFQLFLNQIEFNNFLENFDKIRQICDQAWSGLTQFLIGYESKFSLSDEIVLSDSLVLRLDYEEDFSIKFCLKRLFDTNCFNFTVEDFQFLQKIIFFIQSVNTYNNQFSDSVQCYFNEYVKLCKEKSVDFLNKNLYFEPKVKTQNFYRLFYEIPCLSSALLLNEINKK